MYMTLCNPIDGSPPGSPSLGFFRQEHWSGLKYLKKSYKYVVCAEKVCLLITEFSLYIYSSMYKTIRK